MESSESKCKDCHLVFQNEQLLSQHIILNHADLVSNICKYNGCLKKLSSRNSLDRHINSHAGYKPCLCICGQKMSTIGNLRRHERDTCPLNFKCHQKSLPNNSISTNKDSNIGEETSCSTLNYDRDDLKSFQFNYNFILNRQKRECLNDEPLDLTIGNKKIKLNDENNLDQNSINNENEIKFKTNLLSKYLNPKIIDVLNNVTANESPAGDISADISPINESSNISINESPNISINESPNISINESVNSNLNKSFISVDPFNENDYNFESNKNYICKICKMKVKTKNSLKNHKFKHENKIQPNKCDRCDYTSFNSLKRHNVKHSDKKLFECKLCNKRSSLKANLMRHIKQIHMIKNNDDFSKFLIIHQDNDDNNQSSNDNSNQILNNDLDFYLNGILINAFINLNNQTQQNQLTEEQFVDKLEQILNNNENN